MGSPFAFPSVCMDDPGHPASVPGMTLRDWFAGQIIAGLAAAPMGKFPDHTDQESIAQDAFLIADAMLAERAKS